MFLLSLERRPEEARAVLWELYRLDPQPRHLITAAGLVGVEADGRDLNPALEAFLERTPAAPWLRRARGLTLLLQGRPGEALPHLEAAAAALEGDPTGWLALNRPIRSLALARAAAAPGELVAVAQSAGGTTGPTG